MDAEVRGPGGERRRVLIVGGGLAGLATAMFLAWHGVQPLLVERRPGTSSHPRARGVNPRTMELLRSVGLEDAARATESARTLARNGGILRARSLADPQAQAFRQPYLVDPQEDLGDLTPTGWCLCDQDELEPLLRRRAAELGAELAFGTELTELAVDATGATAWLSGGPGAGRQVRADYVVAADGQASRIRHQLGIDTTGPGTLSHHLNVHFRADLRAALGDRRFLLCYVDNPQVRGVLVPVDNAHRWLLHLMYRPDQGETPADYPAQRCVELIRAAAGQPDLAVTVLDSLPWEAAGRVAERFRAGPVLLAGDAAHVMPPTGAFGANTAVQDAHNLAWKLAAVLGGAAGSALLDSYDAERRPVARLTMEQAVLRSRHRPGKPGGDAADIVPDPVVMFGYGYPAADGAAGSWQPEPDAGPGQRAPHAWVHRGGQRLSVLDLFGRGFVLLAGSAGGAWPEAAEPVSRRFGVAVTAHRFGIDLADPDGRAAAAYRLPPAGAVLVRPDGFVAWRSPQHLDDPERALSAALSGLLCRDGATPDPTQEASEVLR